MSDNYDFFDDGFDDMMSEQKKSSSAVSSDTRFPISYFGEPGTYIFRLYPENYNGKPRMRRVVWSNQIHGYKRVLTQKDDKRIDDLLASVKDYDSKSAGFWRHKKSQDAIMMGYLYSAPEGKSIKPKNTDSAFVMNWLQLKNLDMFFDGLEEEGVSLRQFLHPNKPSNAIKMTIQKVTKGKKTETLITVSATQRNDYELPEMSESLPEGVQFTGLDDIHVKADAFLTDELYAEFEKDILTRKAQIEEFRASNIQDPSDSDQEQGYKVEFDDEVKSASGN